jgi:hypothetical protein
MTRAWKRTAEYRAWMYIVAPALAVTAPPMSVARGVGMIA